MHSTNFLIYSSTKPNISRKLCSISSGKQSLYTEIIGKGNVTFPRVYTNLREISWYINDPPYQKFVL